MDANKMREMREAFERTSSRDHRRQPPKGNNYIDPIAQADWESFKKGWQASREAVVVELPAELPTVPWNDPANSWTDALRKSRATIEAQGLKVAP